MGILVGLLNVSLINVQVNEPISQISCEMGNSNWYSIPVYLFQKNHLFHFSVVACGHPIEIDTR